MQPLRILLVQLGSNGDCLFVTTIAKQIKEVDYPGCNLTWMIGKRFKAITLCNPYIDKVIEIPIITIQDLGYFREKISSLVEEEKKRNHYDNVFVTDYTPGNFKRWFGTTRSSLFRNYPHPLKIDPKPIIYLNIEEQMEVKEFCTKHTITNNSFNILFECSPQSGQSKMTFDIAMAISRELLMVQKNCKIILSSATSFISKDDRIIDGSVVTWRGNAELSKYCDLFIGCSSGITWLLNSNWCKPIKTIQIIDPYYSNGKISASVKLDYFYFGIDESNLIEMHNPTNSEIINCINEVVLGNFYIGKIKYDKDILNGFIPFKFLLELRISLLRKLYLTFKFNLYRGLSDYYRFIKAKCFNPQLYKKMVKKILFQFKL